MSHEVTTSAYNTFIKKTEERIHESSYHINQYFIIFRIVARLSLQMFILKMPIKRRFEGAHAYKHSDISR